MAIDRVKDNIVQPHVAMIMSEGERESELLIITDPSDKKEEQSNNSKK